MLVARSAMLVLFAALVGRLVQVQVLESSTHKEMARRQYEDRVDLPALRGSIFDHHGRILVSSAMDISFAADPKMLGNDRATIARRFSAAFGKPAALYLDKLSSRTTNFVWLERHVTHRRAGVVRSDDVDGLIQIEEPRRVYHYGHVAGQLLGFTDVDGKGISGLELQLDDRVKGKNGYQIMRRDGLGRRMAAVDFPRVEPVNGSTVVLTIDLDYQAIAEEELRKGVEQYRAESGLVVMLDPRSGEILAMANYPSMEPGNAGRYDQSVLRNRIVTDMFEPGSVFKVTTAAAAIEHNLVAPEQKFFAEQGVYHVTSDRVIKDVHPYGTLTFRDAIVFSSNIVMAKISDKIGAELLYRTARDFGFGTETGVGLPGEISGELKKPTQWSGTTLNSMAYGYEVGVTPLQIACAYGVVASGGMLFKPFVLKEVHGRNGEVVEENRPQPIRRVMSVRTAEVLKNFLTGVVERGTGTGASVEGIVVAGKTGTARKVTDGKYVPGNYMATFAGFFPVEDPRAVCVVMLETRSSYYSGGLASAPIFKNIAEKVIALSERFSTGFIAQREQPLLLSIPDAVNLRRESAVALLESDGFEVVTSGEGEFVVGQSPGPGAKLPPHATVRLQTMEYRNLAAAEYVRIPDLRNLSLRRAMHRLRMHELDMLVHGSGTVVAQTPAPGEKVKAGATVLLQCRNGSTSKPSWQ